MYSQVLSKSLLLYQVGLRLIESACKPLQRSISVSYIPLGLLDVVPIDLKRKTFWGSSLWYWS